MFVSDVLRAKEASAEILVTSFRAVAEMTLRLLVAVASYRWEEKKKVALVRVDDKTKKWPMKPLRTTDWRTTSWLTAMTASTLTDASRPATTAA